MKTLNLLLMTAVITASDGIAAKPEITCENKDGYNLVHQPDGPDLGYAPGSGVRIINVDGLAFKSFDGSDTLLPYEDWRLPPEMRAADLAARLSEDEIAGLMLYSPQNWLPMPRDTYGGKTFAESGANAWDLSDDQRRFLFKDNVRHVLVSKVESPVTAARWNNTVQAAIEGIGHGIPANNSSDPRHSGFSDAEFAPGASGQLSQWSNLMGLASTFSPETVLDFARTARAEYRAMGLTTALSPQADLGTDPRWYRFNATFGCDPKLCTDLVKAYAEGFQASPTRADGGWGPGSVNTMAKHWPGGGSGEGGRDAHYGNGKYAVYPGGCYTEHRRVFTDGAFALPGATNKCSAIMPYYTISYGQGTDTVGNSYDSDIITRQLRHDAGYDGVVCTDWCITADQIAPGTHSGKPWGVETKSVAERHYLALMAGVDQFGGNDSKGPVLEAFEMMRRRHGEEWTRRRIEESARRLLMNIFRPGLFENPYVDVEETARIVGSPQLMAKGFAQQVASVVMLKNHNAVLPVAPTTKVYVPERRLPEIRNYWGGIEPAKAYMPISQTIARDRFELVTDPAQANMAIVFIESPKSYRMGYDPADKEAGGNGYIPISLQYRAYTATTARAVSIARDPAEGPADIGRSYRGKTAHTQNECDLDLVADTRRLMGERPVVVVIDMSNPTVLTEVEPLADAILVGFNVTTQAFADLIAGRSEPSGLLPFEMPASMEAVERHCEDRPHDIEPYTDADGNTYSFAYGLNWSGPISDARTARYASRRK